MADASWDNSGLPPEKKGMPTWAKVLLGCGALFLLVMGSCVGGCVWIGNKAKKDPEGFKKTIMGFAIKQIRPSWEDFRRVVGQLHDDEGTKALYRAEPELAKEYQTEEAFLEAVRSWRPKLEALPELDEKSLERGHISIQRNFGEEHVSFRTQAGDRIEVDWDRAHGQPGRRLIRIEVR
jgi:hypothetical protein